jgi:hypothetical protein
MYLFKRIIATGNIATNIIIVPCIIFVPVIFLVMQASLLLNKPKPEELMSIIKRSLNKHMLGSLLSQQIRLIYIISIVSIPVIAIGVLLFFVIPTYVKDFADHRQSLPFSVNFLLICSNFMSKHSFILFVPLKVIPYLLVGRLVWLLDFQNLKSFPSDKTDNAKDLAREP